MSQNIQFKNSPFSSWSLLDYGSKKRKVTPKQNNDYDCGFMVCDTMKHIVKNKTITKDSPNPFLMDKVRLRIAYELVQAKLL